MSENDAHTTQTESNVSTLSDEEKELVVWYRALPEKKQIHFMKMVRSGDTPKDRVRRTVMGRLS